MRRIEPYSPQSHGVPRLDDRRVISGIIFVVQNGLRWCDAPKGYSPHTTIYSRFIRCSAALTPGIPSRTNREALIPHDSVFYHPRHSIENMVGRLKDWRRIHTRYDQCADAFMSAL